MADDTTPEPADALEEAVHNHGKIDQVDLQL